MSEPTPIKPHVLVLGGGFAGLEATFNLRARLGRHVDLTLVSDSTAFKFKPNTIYIPFGKEPERYVVDLMPAMERRSVRFVHGRAFAIDPEAKRVTTDREVLGYDYLVVATGATMRAEEVPGLAEHGNTIWTPEEMLRLRERFEQVVAAARSGTRQRVVFMVPPQNKCAGPLYEMVMMLDTWLRRREVRDAVEITYATYESHYIQAFGPRLHEVVVREFDRRGITGHVATRVSEVTASRVHFSDGLVLDFDLLVSFPPYVAATRFDGLPADDRGFLGTVATTRQVIDSPDIYAVGDAGDFPVKQAFLALLQADTAAEHIAQRIQGAHPDARFEPVSMCIMEQFDTATFAQVPLMTTGDPAMPVKVRDDRPELYKVGTNEIWRLGKKMLGTVLPARFKAGLPFHAGATWAAMAAGLDVMAHVFAD